MEDQPSLFDQTIALGTLLKSFSDRDPQGHPSAGAAQAFRSWLEVAGKRSREPRYFADVADNYDIDSNSNRDLFDIFELLHPYIEVDDEDSETGSGS